MKKQVIKEKVEAPTPVRIPPNMLSELKQVAKEETRSLSNIIIVAIKEFLDNRKKKK